MRTIALVLMVLAGCLQAPTPDADAEAAEAWPEVLPSTASIGLPLDSTARLEVAGQGWGQLIFHGSGLLDVRLTHSVFQYDNWFLYEEHCPPGAFTILRIDAWPPLEEDTRGFYWVGGELFSEVRGSSNGYEASGEAKKGHLQ